MKAYIQITSRLGALSLQIDASFTDGIIIVSGENGAGKTTLLRCLAGLESAQGKIIFDGQIWLDSHADFVLPSEIRHLGCVWADPALLPWLSVENNIILGTNQMDISRLRQLAEQLKICPLLKRKPHMLSTGEAQRVALARAIYRRPVALLLDEPFSAQAPAIRQHLRSVLKSIQKEMQIPVIMVSHNVEDAKLLAHDHWRMSGGRLLASIKQTSMQRRCSHE